MSRILVTGGAGMIGSNLVRELVKNGHSVKVIDNLWRGKVEYLYDEHHRPIINMEQDFFNLDLSLPNIAEKALENVEYVFHLADIVAGINYVFNNQGSLFRKNLIINSNIIETVRSSKIKGFIYVGTACSFPASKQQTLEAVPLHEDDLYPAEPESAYGWSKLMGNYETALMEKETPIKTVSLILHNVYGAPADFSPERSQVIPSLVRKAIKYPDEQFVVWGSGSQSRAFVHVDDITNALILALNNGLGFGDIQIGPAYSTSIREIAESVVEISGKNIVIKYDASKPEGDKSRCADFSKAKKVLGWEPRIELKEGLTRLYKWMETKIR